MQLDKSYIGAVLQQIADKTFPPGPKRKIKLTHKGFEMACPICGDSAKNPHKKRGNLFFNSMMFVCFNEGCKRTFTSLCNGHSISLDPSKKMEIMKYLEDTIRYTRESSDEYVVTRLDKLLDVKELVAYFDSGKDSLQSLRPTVPGDGIYEYLLARKVSHSDAVETYSGICKITDRWWEPVVVFMNRTGDKVLGLQYRNLKDGYRRMFKIYTFEHLYNALHPDKPLDEMEAIGYNKLSGLFNIMNVDFDKKVTAFEGYMDSLFFPNSIGAVGVNSDFSFLTTNEVDVRFFFDNDDAGMRKARRYMDEGHSVFLWKKLMEDVAKRRGDFYDNLKTLSGVKDLNRLAALCPNPYHRLGLEQYFSSTDADGIWLPKPRYKKRNTEPRYSEYISWDGLRNKL